MGTRYFDLPRENEEIVDHVTEYTAAMFTKDHDQLDANLAGALFAIGEGVVPDPSNAMLVSAGTGLYINIVRGKAILNHSTNGPSFVYMESNVSYGPLPSSDTTYVFVKQKNAIKDGVPDFIWQSADTYDGGILLATVTTGASTISSVTPNADRFIAMGGEGGGHIIQDGDGDDLTQRTVLQFTGDGVDVADVGGKTVVTIAGQVFHGFTAKASTVNADELLIYDSVAGDYKKITKADFVGSISFDATKIWYGEGVPPDELGKDGDFYFDITAGDTDDFYAREDGTWNTIARVKGPKGDKGDKGDTGDDGIFSAIASQAEAQAGIETTKGMNSLRVKEAISYQAILKSIVTTKGDLLVATGSGVPVRFAIGANGKVLSPNSAQTTGLEWVDNTPANGTVTNAKVATGANIDAAKLGTGAVSTTELNHLTGVTSSIQGQFDTSPTKRPVRCATTANITLSGTQTIDGVAAVAGNRVLVKNQTTASQNGIYVVASGAWSRSTDADNSAKVFGGIECRVNEGTTNADKNFVLTTNDTITLGTTSLTFTPDASGGSSGTFASQSEAEAGTNTTNYMNPLRTAQAIAALGGGGGDTTDYTLASLPDATTNRNKVIFLSDLEVFIGSTGTEWRNLMTGDIVSDEFGESSVAGLEIWLKADSITGSDGDFITTWSDASSANNDVIQASSGAKPTLQTNEINSLPVVRFDGGDYLSNASFAVPMPCTIYFVSKNLSGGLGVAPFSAGSSSAKGSGIIVQQNSGYMQPFDVVNYNDATARLLTLVDVNGVSGATGYLNGALESIAQPGVGTYSAPFDVGRRNVSDLKTAGDIAEILIYSGAHNSTERTIVESYLLTKYAIS